MKSNIVITTLSLTLALVTIDGPKNWDARPLLTFLFSK